MSKDRGALTERPFVMVGPQGLAYVGIHKDEAACWQVALGWPCQEEIDARKAEGFAVRPATLTWVTNEDPADPSVHEPKPAAYVVWAENGNCIMWTTNKAQAQACAAKHQRPMRELYDQDVVTGLLAAEEGAAEAFGVVVQQKRDLEAEVRRLQSLLDGAYATARKYAKAAGA